ncbi:TetR family transcriptional regulator [Actinocorallia herbida]|uniref:TetR family transcriptional regulator n=1 Tax=Actinocorallia herbida TaxID=58109 RepID=A0A3N1D530_9ACTN|nr:TetR family transcriptional regulator [Actinocorallia herbida]ROO88653.1 TetR family transcriptional regulator [Actinocorallia herbida]
MARSPSGLRERLLDAALRLFVAHGYRGTSLHDIAVDAGCAKASLVYHFGCKAAILNEVLAPAVRSVTLLRERLAEEPDDSVAAEAVAGLVDLSLRYRGEMTLLLSDFAEAGAVKEWGGDGAVPSVTEALLSALSGRSSDPADRVRAAMVLGGVAVACASSRDLPAAPMREQLVHDSLRVLGRERAPTDTAT